MAESQEPIEGKAEAMRLALALLLFRKTLIDFAEWSVEYQLEFGLAHCGLDAQSMRAALAFINDCDKRLQAAFDSS